MKRVLYYAVIGCVLISCDPRRGVSFNEVVTSQADGFVLGDRAYKVSNAAQATPVTVERKLIKNVVIEFEVDDIDATTKAITEMTIRVGGYITSDSQNDYGAGPRFEQTVRIPADTLDAFMAKVESLAKRIDHRNTSSNDVTEEFIDVETRLNTKKELEARYRDLLKQARELKDIVEIESHLATVRGEIESMEGRMKYLTNQVAFSTLRLEYYKTTAGNYGFGSRFSNTFGKGWDMLLEFIIGVFTLWPFVIMLGVATWFFIRWRRRKRKS